MANSLDKELVLGDVVVAKRKAVKASVKDLRMVVNYETFGTSPHTIGTKIAVTWVEDGQTDVWNGMLLDPKATEEAQAAIINDPVYGWLFKIIRDLKNSRLHYQTKVRQLQEEVNSLKKSARTRVVAIYTFVLLDDDKFQVDVLRSNGSLRSYRVSRKMNSWLYSNLVASKISSAFWGGDPNSHTHGRVRLYP